MIKILIVDDSRVFRKRLQAFLAAYPEIQVVGEVGDGLTALSVARRLMPDIVLMDMKIGDINGLSVTNQLKKKLPEIKVIILSKYDLKAYHEAAQASGASAYVTKRALVDELLPTIHRVLEMDQST